MSDVIEIALMVNSLSTMGFSAVVFEIISCSVISADQCISIKIPVTPPLVDEDSNMDNKNTTDARQNAVPNQGRINYSRMV